jgi:hypothetical protein
MLPVIHHQQNLFVAQLIEDLLLEWSFILCELKANVLSYRRDNLLNFCQRLQRDEKNTMREVVKLLLGSFQRQARLAHAARSQNRHQAHLWGFEYPRQFIEFGVPSDKRRSLVGQIVLWDEDLSLI